MLRAREFELDASTTRAVSLRSLRNIIVQFALPGKIETRDNARNPAYYIDTSPDEFAPPREYKINLIYYIYGLSTRLLGTTRFYVKFLIRTIGYGYYYYP